MRILAINNKGVSLVELMIVVSIIGILATIAIPNYQKHKNKARQGEAKVVLSNLYTAEKMFIAKYGYGATNFYQLGFHPKGNFYYNSGFNNTKAASDRYLAVSNRVQITGLTVPYRGPLAPRFKENNNAIYNYCAIPFYIRTDDNGNPRYNSDCFLVNGRLKDNSQSGSRNPDIKIPENIPGSALGETSPRNVTVENVGYRNVKFLIGASTLLSSKDEWYMTDSKKLINLKSGL